MSDIETKCKWCGRLVDNGYDECPGCWQVRSLIEWQPELAHKIFEAVRPEYLKAKK